MGRLPVRLRALLLALCLASACAAAEAAGSAGPGILGMMEAMPMSAFDDGWLSFADIGVMIANQPGAAPPADMGAYERMKDTDAGSLLLNAYMGLSAGASDFYNKLPIYRELLETSGIDFFSVRQTAEAGILPNRQLWLAGGMDTVLVRAALQKKGYALLPDTQEGTEVWCRDGDPASGARVSLADRDTGFLFGGNLGQFWPVLFRGGLIGATPDAGAVSAAAYTQEPSLAEPGVLRDLTEAVTRVKSETGDIAQLYLLTPSAAGLDLPALPEALGGSAAAARADAQLPAYYALALAHVYTPGAQWVMVGLAFPDTDSARAAEPVLARRLEQARLPGNGGPLMARVGDMNGQLEPFQTTAGTACAVLTLPFHFPDESASADNGGRPLPPGAAYRLFTRLLMQRGLGWLSQSQP